MRFLDYCYEKELPHLYDDFYDYPNGIIFQRDDVPHIAVKINFLNKKQPTGYAIFECAGLHYDNKNKSIQFANWFSEFITSFADEIITSALGKMIPLAEKKLIQSALMYNQTTPIGDFKSYSKGIAIEMQEQEANGKSSWTISINGDDWVTLKNEKAAFSVFRGLNESVMDYIALWKNLCNRQSDRISEITTSIGVD